MDTQPVIDIRDLKVTYPSSKGKTREAVRGLTLQVQKGEVVGLIGPNGAGKTTTIKILMGFLFPTSGTARVFGLPAGSVEARRRTGFLPEVAIYYPFLTAWETIMAYATLQEIPRDDRKRVTQELLERVGLTGREREPLRNFSKGMLQRVGLAQAIMGDPDLLLLDEVTSGLDPVARRDVREILLEFKSAGKTVFFSSHELSEVTMLCDRIILLDEGKVLEEKSLEQIQAATRLTIMVVRAPSVPTPLPRDVSLRSKRDGLITLVAHTEAAREALSSQFQESGLELVETYQEAGSLEDYFVNTIGHKVT